MIVTCTKCGAQSEISKALETDWLMYSRDTSIFKTLDTVFSKKEYKCFITKALNEATWLCPACGGYYKMMEE